MSLIALLVMLVVCGFLSWIVIRFIPMPAPFPQVFIAIIVIAFVLFALNYFGLWHGRIFR